MRVDDNATDHLVVVRLYGRTRRCDLLHTRDHTARRGRTDRGSSSRAPGPGRNRSVRAPGLVASTVCLDGILLAAFLPRSFDLAYPNLPRHLATDSPFRLAWSGGASLRRGRHRPAAGLLYRGDVSEMDG